MSEKTNKTTVYCCGGAGLNLGAQVAHPDLTVCFIDTSVSNKTDKHGNKDCYHIAGLDGSGKNRKENYAVIAKEIPGIMELFRPGDFNIVLFSASGGSGSVLGPLIIKSLLEEKQAVVGVMLGSEDSSITINNTLNTFKSLESISLMVGQPIVINYHENTVGVNRKMVDDGICFAMEALGILTSQKNKELDTQDLVNWVQYQKVSPLHPQLSFLSIADNRQSAQAVIEPIAIASLYTDAGKDNPFGSPYYNTVGFPSESDMTLSEQLHFIINIVDVEENLKRLQARQLELHRNYSRYQQRKSVVDIDDNMTGDGLVL